MIMYNEVMLVGSGDHYEMYGMRAIAGVFGTVKLI